MSPPRQHRTHQRTSNSINKNSKKNFRKEIISISSSSHQTADHGSNEKVDTTDYDSTASTPKVERKRVSKRISESDRKSAKLKFNTNLGRTSAPPKLRFKADGIGTSDENEYKMIRKNLFCKPEADDDNDFYLNYDPSSIKGYEGFDSNFVIPDWIPIIFRPTRTMSLNQISAYTAAYIFMRDDEQLNGDEVLIKSTSSVVADRTKLKSLMPRSPVDQEILNLVVAQKNWLMGSLGKNKTVWYLPTEFAQYVLDSEHKADRVRKIYQGNFMTPTPFINKIFIPINDEGVHWYLLIVDFIERKLVWLDSLPSVERYNSRQHNIFKLALFLQEILLHESFAEFRGNSADKFVTKFDIVQPRHIPQQRPGSNDCGVWVSKWMIEGAFRFDYENINVVTATRMKLALYLCQASNNVLYNEVLAKATDFWSYHQKKRNDLVKL